MEEQIIIDVQLSDAEFVKQAANVKRQIDELKQANKDLQKQVKDGTLTDEEAAKQMERNNAQIKNLQATYNSYSKSVQGLNIDNAKLGDSLNEMRLRLRNLQSQYAALTKEQRENKNIGGNLLKSIQQLDDEVKGTEATMGDFRRNVGNYPTLLSNLVPGFSKVSGAVDKLGISFSGGLVSGLKNAGAAVTTFGKLLLTTPVGWIAAGLAAVVAVLSKLRDAFLKNDEAGTAVSRLFASFQPILTMTSKLLDAVVGWLGKLANGLADIIAYFSDSAKAAQDQVLALDNLEEAERRYTVNSAKRNEEISELRAKAAEKDKYTANERRKFLEQATELELANYEDEKKIAEERLRTLREQQREEVNTSDELANKIAEAEAKVHDTRKAYNDARRNLNKQITAVDSELTKQQEDNAKRRQAIADKERQQIEEAKKKEEEIRKKAEDFALSLIKDEDARTIAARKLQGDREIAELQRTLTNEKNLTEAARNELANLITAKQAALDAELEKMADDATDRKAQKEREQAERLNSLRLELAQGNAEEELEYRLEQLDLQLEKELANTETTEEEKQLIREAFAKRRAKLDSEYWKQLAENEKEALREYKTALLGIADQAGGVFSAMNDLLEEYGEKNKAAAKAARAFGLASIVADQAVAIANTAKAITEATAAATAAAAAAGPAAPFIQPVYVATMTASVLSAVAGVINSIKQARTLLAGSQAFAEGGIVQGTSYTGDRVSARVNSGEMILTRAQQAQLFEIANNRQPAGGIDYDQMARVVTAAVASQPAPVLTYKEFTNFSEKVTNYNELARL